MKKNYILLLAIIFLSFKTKAQIPNFVFSNNLTGSASGEQGLAVTADGAGNIYITGYFASTIDFDPSAAVASIVPTGINAFVAKYGPSGAYQWAFNIPVGSKGYGIASDASNNIYVTGYFNGTADFDPSAGVANLTSTGASQDIFVAKYNSSGVYQWAFNLGSTSIWDQGYSAAVDVFGDIYITGTFGGTVDFDPSAATQNLVSSNVNDQDLFVAKYNSAGNYINAFKVGNTGLDINYALSSDPSGNIYITGQYQGTADFDPSASVANVASAGGSTDIYVAKYNTAGVYQWAFAVGSGSNFDYGIGISSDASGNCYVTGAFQNTVDFDPSASTANITATGATYNAFVAKYNTSGLYQWAFKLPTAGGFGNGISTDASGNSYVTGYFYNSGDFDPGAGVSTLTSAGNDDLFFAKYNSSGTYQWAFSLGSAASDDMGNGTLIDPLNNLYLVGMNSGNPLLNKYCTLPSQPVSISGPTLVCSGSANTYSVAVVAGATSYTWTTPGGWTGTSTTNTISTTASATSGNITVKATNACGNSPMQTLSVTITNAPTTPGAISGNITICSGSANTYSVASVAGATSYTWSLPGGWTGSSSTNIINTTASATSGNVTVTASNACGTSAAQTLSVTVNSIPATPGAISGNITICSGSANTYSIATVAGATAYTWVKPAGWAGASTTNIINTTASANSGNVTVSASNACGTSAVQTLSVTVNVTPATPGTISGNITICSGSSNTYSVTSVAGATSYNWLYPGGWSGASGTNIINTTASATSGNVSVSASNACGTSAIKTLSVTVNSAPTTPGAISGLATLCSGATASNYSVASVAGATSYTWSLAGGWSGASSTNIISATPGSSGIFTVTATNSCGTSAQQTLSVTVNSLPTISVNSGSICSGQTFTIVPSGANTYTIQGGSATVSPGTTTSYTVVGTSAQGCVSSSPATSNVTVSATPTISVAGGAICPGNSFTLNPSGASTYTFSSGPVVSPTTTTSYSVTGTSAAGCVSGPAVATVTVANTLTVTIAGSNTVCNGSSLNLVAGGATTYTWNTGATTTTITPTPTVNTTYSVTGASGSCSNTAMFSVTVNPTPTVSAVTSTSLICVGQSATLTASGASTYTWNPGGAGTSISISPTVTATYTVTGTDLNGCTNVTTITQNVSGCVGIVTLSGVEGQISVYPNPFTNKFTVEISNGIESPIQIFNPLGALIYTGKTENGKAEIDLKDQANGIYFVKIGSVTKKIIKE